MRVVIFDQETYEPLTVVTVPANVMREIERGVRDRSYRFPIPHPVQLSPDPNAQMGLVDKASILRVSFEPIYKGDRLIMWLCTAEDGVSALLLRSTFLPGQQKDVNAIEQQAFIRGLLSALA